MAGANNYTALIKAVLDTSGVKTQLDNVAKSTNFNIPTKGVDNLNKGFKEIKKTNEDIFSVLKKNVYKVAEWAVSTNLVYGTLNQIRKAIEYITELNTEITKIGMVTGQTPEQLRDMAIQFNDMARELGVDTLTMAEGATEWIRAGKTAAETTEFLTNSTMLAKLGNLEAADATDKLIAVTNAYNISAEESIEVVDTLVSLDNSFATSTGEIAAAMQKSSSMARLAGVSYRDLASYIK